MSIKYLFWGILFFSQLLFAQPDANSIIKKVGESNRITSQRIEILMELVDKKGRIRKRRMEVYIRFENNLSRSLVFFLEPHDVRGTGFLSIEREEGNGDQWLYLPALGKEKRIAGKGLGQSFMGSEFTFEDLSPSKIEDAVYSLIREEELNGSPVYVIEATPVEESTYQKQVIWVDKERWVVPRIIFFDKKGRELKQLTGVYSNDKDIWYPVSMLMQNLQNQKETRLTYRNQEVNPKIPGNFFTVKRLRQGL